MPNRPIRSLVQNQQLHVVEKGVTVRTAAHIMQTARIGSVMVVEHDALVGIFTERDALFRVLAG
ncbi:CBS domain-containing protein, partial [bacterium]|nr:CBS domain-containing protein [bacterium]